MMAREMPASLWRNHSDAEYGCAHPSNYGSEQAYPTFYRHSDREADDAKRRRMQHYSPPHYHRSEGRLPPSTSARSSPAESWQWSHFPDRQGRLGGQTSFEAPVSAPVPTRTAKQSVRQQRKRSAGCLNCLTIWSPTWRKDSQGLMRCNACGLYLAARGQERPLALIPKRKACDELPQPNPPRSPTAFHRPHPRRAYTEEEHLYRPSYPSSDQSGSLRPSPSLSFRSLAMSPSSSSSHSLPMADQKEHAYLDSPATSPFPFDSISLDSAASAKGNTLGLEAEGVSRTSLAENTARRSTRPTNARAYHSERRTASPDGRDACIPRIMLPPLSELTRSLASWRPTHQSWHAYTHDRQQTGLLDAGLGRELRMMSS